MDASLPTPKPGGSELLLGHCLALEPEPQPTARDRLELLLGRELAGRLVSALCTPRR